MHSYLATVLVALAVSAAAAEVPIPLSVHSVPSPMAITDQEKYSASVPDIPPGSLGSFLSAPDGTRYLALRIQTPGGARTRVLLENMRLPEGCRLLVYGLRDGSLTDVAGPWYGSGRLGEAPFWTDPVRGSEIVLELQVDGNELPADLPFRVTRIAWDEEDNAEPARPSADEVRTSLYRGTALTHAVRDGFAVFEGDIILGRADELPGARGGKKSAGRSAVAITGSRYRWPGGVIPYLIDAAMPSSSRVVNAIDHWNHVMGGAVKLVPRTDEVNHVYFVRASNAGQCASAVGMIGYRQYVWVGDHCSDGNVIHEIGHAVGLWHEHGREDRDQYVNILWDNILSSAAYNFNQNVTNGDDINGYDFGSIMHYPANAFSSNGKSTIETIPAGIPIGQRQGLSSGDVAAAMALYPPVPPDASATPVPISVTVTSNPAGMPVTVDGITYTAPRTFEWLPSSTHTISAQDPPIANGVRATFQRWSDGGARSHTVTTPANPAMFKADYSLAYFVTTSTSGGGSIWAWPATVDGFYAPNATLRLTAIPGYGKCFSGWSGLIAGTPSYVALQVVRPYSLAAAFQTGSVTLSSTMLSAAAVGGTVQVGVTATSGCLWTPVSGAAWVRPTSGVTGTGSSVLSFTVDPNPTASSRTAVVSVGSNTLLILQTAGPY